MAIDAMVANARPSTEVPVAAHSAMRAMPIVTHLRAMALPAQRHGLNQRKCAPVGQVQRLSPARVVASPTAELPMAERKASVGSLDRRVIALAQRIGAACMAAATRCKERSLKTVDRPGANAPQDIRHVNLDGVTGAIARARRIGGGFCAGPIGLGAHMTRASNQTKRARQRTEYRHHGDDHMGYERIGLHHVFQEHRLHGEDATSPCSSFRQGSTPSVTGPTDQVCACRSCEYIDSYAPSLRRPASYARPRPLPVDPLQS